jgi:hypothetical protein
MTQITEPSTAEIVKRYADVWSEPDPERRHAAIAALWAPDGAEFVASGRFRVTVADDQGRHDDIVTCTIQLTAPGGEVAWAACVFLLLGEDGLIREDYQLTVQPLAG